MPRAALRLAPVSAAVAALTALSAAPAPAQVPSGLPEPVAPIDADGLVPDYLRCIDEAGVTLLSAHRGGPEPGYPENAIETFAHTLAFAPMLIETDVRRTADGVFVLMHDAELERTTTGEGRVDETPWAELRRLNLVDDEGAETGFHPPALADALAWAEGRSVLQLDVKRGVDPVEVARFVAAAGARDRTAIIVYSAEDAVAVAEAVPGVAVSVQITEPETLAELEAAGVDPARLMAWTGVADAGKPELWATLDAAGVPAAFGALWRIDGRVEETGDASVYAELARQGLDILSTDLDRLAYETLADIQDAPAAVAACTRAQAG